MTQTTITERSESPNILSKLLQVYQIEFFGRLLDKLPFPPSPPLIFLLFVFLNFGGRLIIKSLLGTPWPSSFEAIFQPADPAAYYYPNLTAIMNDLIGTPLMVTLLILFRSYIPNQFEQLKQSGFIEEIKEIEDKQAPSIIARYLHFFGTATKGQKLAIIGFPLAFGILGIVADIWNPAQSNLHEAYALGQSFVGRYARMVIIVQLVYVFLILRSYNHKFKLYLSHPDGCSGLHPYGNLAVAGYIYLFIHAMLQAIGTLGGGTGFERALRTFVGSWALIYLWILFPLVIIFIFSELLYKPHSELQKIQKQHLLKSSLTLTDYHQKLTSSIIETIEQTEAPLTDKTRFHFNDDIELLGIWSKLNKYVEDMHTWPIPKRTFRFLAIFANPLIPILLSTMGEALRNLLT